MPTQISLSPDTILKYGKPFKPDQPLKKGAVIATFVPGDENARIFSIGPTFDGHPYGTELKDLFLPMYTESQRPGAELFKLN